MFIVVYLYCQYFTESLKSYEIPVFYDTHIYPTLAHKLLEVLPFETGPQSRKLKERLDGLLPGELKRLFCLLKRYYYDVNKVTLLILCKIVIHK